MYFHHVSRKKAQQICPAIPAYYAINRHDYPGKVYHRCILYHFAVVSRLCLWRYFPGWWGKMHVKNMPLSKQLSTLSDIREQNKNLKDLNHHIL
jgi:hypothetical protein